MYRNLLTKTDFRNTLCLEDMTSDRKYPRFVSDVSLEGLSN